MDRVAAGEEVMITRRGRPRMRLSPAAGPAQDLLAAGPDVDRLGRLEHLSNTLPYPWTRQPGTGARARRCRGRPAGAGRRCGRGLHG